MSYATCMCIIFSVLALVNALYLVFSVLALFKALDLGFSSSDGWLRPHFESLPKRIASILILAALAGWAGISSSHDDEVSHCCFTHHCQGGNQMIISTMQYPGQGMSYDSVYRQRDSQPPLPAD